jgi:hypothetical protein
VYGYRLRPAGEHETDVTSYCDWSNVREKFRTGTTWPVVPVEALESSLAKLDRIVTGREP